MENLNILSKWEETGLLQGIVPEMKEMVASGLESLASLLSKDSDFESEELKEFFMGTVLPVYRRLVTSEKVPEVYPLYSHYKLWLTATIKNTSVWSSEEDPEMYFILKYMLICNC